MRPSDHPPLVAIAMLAARADGRATQVGAGGIRVADLAARLSDDEARRVAYETALAVCNADGAAGADESRFLSELRAALGLAPAMTSDLDGTARALAAEPSAPAD